MTFKLALHSFKGGPGKSTLTANLAVTLSLAGKRVGVIDMDLGGPGLHVIFQLKKSETKHTLHNVLLGKSSASEAVVDLTKRLGIEKGLLVFIPASEKAEDIVSILQKEYELSILRKTIDEISSKYSLDYLLIDTSPGIGQSTLLAMGLADSVMLISRVDNQDLYGTGVTLEVARALRKPVYLLLNLVPPHINMKKTRDRLETVLKISPLDEIPFYVDVLRSLSTGAFVLKYPDHEFSAKIRSISKEVMRMQKESSIGKRREKGVVSALA